MNTPHKTSFYLRQDAVGAVVTALLDQVVVAIELLPLGRVDEKHERRVVLSIPVLPDRHEAVVLTDVIRQLKALPSFGPRWPNDKGVAQWGLGDARGVPGMRLEVQPKPARILQVEVPLEVQVKALEAVQLAFNVNGGDRGHPWIPGACAGEVVTIVSEALAEQPKPARFLQPSTSSCPEPVAVEARDFLINLYLDWRNNWLSVEAFAQHHGLNDQQAIALLATARTVVGQPHPES